MGGWTIERRPFHDPHETGCWYLFIDRGEFEYGRVFYDLHWGKGELASSTETGMKIAEKRVWYALWGMIPLGDNSTDALIPETAKKIRFETRETPLDALINLFTIIVSIETFKVDVYEVK